MTSRIQELASILPDTAAVNKKGHLVIGQCDTVDLVGEFGTPLYVFDEATVRNKCREYRSEFAKSHPSSEIKYACKAFINQTLARLFHEEGLGLDVVSGGEIYIAQSAGFPMDKVHFHGNNKSEQELRMALAAGTGRIAVDNFHELNLLNDIAGKMNKTQDVLLRVSPGIDPHTHAKTTTGTIDSKFGFPIETGQAEEALRRAMDFSNLKPLGLHFHLGSPIIETGPYQHAIEVVLRFAAEMKSRYEFELKELCPGGGFAIPYLHDDPCPFVAEYAKALSSKIERMTTELDLAMPRLIVEPGRSITGRAGIALYRSGSTKTIPGIRKYVSLDGGMSDNIRPAFYDAKYEALLANKVEAKVKEQVTLAGKHCESGDILIKDIGLPDIQYGDVVAILVTGAYCLSMSSNYNASLKPAIVMVNGGEASLIQRRETYQDLISRDINSRQVCEV